MRVLILHDGAADGPASPDVTDALAQADVFEDALRAAGHEVGRAGVTLDLRDAAARIRGAGLVVNLVESLGGRGSLIHVAACLVESLGVPMTGCPADAVFATSNKLVAKRLLRGAGVATPDWVETGQAAPGSGRWIIKSVWEHASIGIDDGAIVEAPEVDVPREVASRAASLGGLAFAEAFIEGREFNLSIIERGGEPWVLPPAEIDFIGYGPGRPRIVGYAAKWHEGSFEYVNTPRRFDVRPGDEPLLESLVGIAARCWRLFGLRGYARVDFRVDAEGRPWVLEINTNPCVAPEAGFMAAAGRAGLTPREAVGFIVAAALRP